MAVKVAQEWLNACSGCEIAIVDMGERLLDILAARRLRPQPGPDGPQVPRPARRRQAHRNTGSRVGIVSGGVRNEEHVEVLEEMRRKCQIIVALGTCATHGGIPALANSYTSEEMLQRVYSTETTDAPAASFDEDVPPLLDACYALDEKVKVDVYLPGCPPHPDHVFEALTALATGSPLNLPGRSVCDHCPTVREGKGQLKTLRRFLQSPALQSARRASGQDAVHPRTGDALYGAGHAGRVRGEQDRTPLHHGQGPLPRMLRAGQAKRQSAAGHAECPGIQRNRHFISS